MLRILAQDPHLVAVDKPAGRLVIPGRGAPETSLREEVEALVGHVWVVHRLDRGTSGVLLFARSAEAHRTLNMAFDRQSVSKRYLAIVRGEPPEERRVDLPLAPARRGRMRPARPGDPRAKVAATYFRTLERFPSRTPLPALALLEVVPETGRTHQIRVHLAAAGCPLAVDPDYGEAEPIRDAAGAVLIDRTPLHASRVEFQHPVTGRQLVLEAPLPEDMERTLRAARG
ncbi:MAG TPA: RluA family pseudouridine synthase [Anaeromyxobacteraceae bacterium]|nr:RluA family pseudouridine synthase [Anaeromyxobacteraceae bacterium]